ncbi:MAG: DnaJ domain-containing protein [Candidatus Helarchaeota archaeon]
MRKSEKKDYYKILGIDRNASIRDINIAFKKLAFKYHPDMNADNIDENKEKFIELNEAHKILRDPFKRRLYDEKWEREHKKESEEESKESYDFTTVNHDENLHSDENKQQSNKQHVSHVTKFFQKVNYFVPKVINQFNKYYNHSVNFYQKTKLFVIEAKNEAENIVNKKKSIKNSKQSPYPIKELIYGKINISLEEAYLGKSIDVKLPKDSFFKESCWIRVELPKRIENKSKIKIDRKLYNKTYYDLYLQFNIIESDGFKTAGKNIILDLPADEYRDYSGQWFRISGLGEEPIDLVLPHKIKNHQTFIFKRRGLGITNPGDLVVRLSV